MIAITVICPIVPVKYNLIAFFLATELSTSFLLQSKSVKLFPITPPTNRAKLEPFDKTNAGNPHKYRLSAFQSVIQTRKVWFDVGYFNVVIYTVLY